MSIAENEVKQLKKRQSEKPVGAIKAESGFKKASLEFGNLSFGFPKPQNFGREREERKMFECMLKC